MEKRSQRGAAYRQVAEGALLLTLHRDPPAVGCSVTSQTDGADNVVSSVGRVYHRVAVIRLNGSRYETRFFACSQCSVMFLNHTQFNAISTAAPNIEFPPIVTPLKRRQ